MHPRSQPVREPAALPASLPVFCSRVTHHKDTPFNPPASHAPHPASRCSHPRQLRQDLPGTVTASAERWHRNLNLAPSSFWGHPHGLPPPVPCTPSPTRVHAGADAVLLAAEAVGIAPAAPVPEALAGPRLPPVVPHHGELGAGAAGVLVQVTRSGNGRSPPALTGAGGCCGHPSGDLRGPGKGNQSKHPPSMCWGTENPLSGKRRCNPPPPSPPTRITGHRGMHKQGMVPVPLTHCAGVPGGGLPVLVLAGGISWGHPRALGCWLLSAAEQKR